MISLRDAAEEFVLTMPSLLRRRRIRFARRTQLTLSFPAFAGMTNEALKFKSASSEPRDP